MSRGAGEEVIESVSLGRGSAFVEKGAGVTEQDARTGGHAGGEVAVPAGAERDVGAASQPDVGQLPLLQGSHPVEHLVLETLRSAPVAQRQLLGQFDDARVEIGRAHV